MASAAAHDACKELLACLATSGQDGSGSGAIGMAASRLRQVLSALPEPLSSSEAKMLDMEGVTLWNTIQVCGESIDPASLASARYAAAVLLHRGGPVVMEPRDSLRYLGLYHRTVTALLQVDAVDEAEEALTSAAVLASALEQVEPADVPRGSHSMVASFYTQRAQLAIRQKKLSVAEFALTKVCCDKYVYECKPAELRAIVVQIVSLCNRLISNKGDAASTPSQAASYPAACKWAREAVKLAERLPPDSATESLKDAAMSCLVTAALKSVSPDDLAAASAALPELIEKEPTFARLRQNVRLCIQQGQHASVVLNAFERAYAAMTPESVDHDIAKLLQEVHRVPETEHSSRCQVVLGMLQHVLNRDDSKQCIFRVLMALARAAGERNLEVLQTGMAACAGHFIQAEEEQELGLHLHLWRQADRLADAGKLEEAIEWFSLSAMKPPFTSDELVNKANRKIAICQMRRHDFGAADDAIRRCTDEASAATVYVRFLLWTLRGEEDAAIRELHQLADSHDFRAEMLMWAIQQAGECGLEKVLLESMNLLASVGAALGGRLDSVDPICLVRCAVRMLIEDGARQEDPNALGHTLLGQYRSACQLAKQAGAESQCDISKDLLWLIDVGWNQLVAHQPQWQPSLLASFADTVGDLIEHTRQHSDLSPRVIEQLGKCRLLVLAKGKSVLQPEELLQRAERLAELAFSFPSASLDISAVFTPQFDAACALNSEERAISVLQSIEAISDQQKQSKLLQSLAWQLLQRKAMDETVFLNLMDHILQALMAAQAVDINAYVQWTRLMMSACVERGFPDRAYGHAESAIDLLKKRPSAYPTDEALWILSYSWEVGIDAKEAGDIDRAQSWCGLAMSVAPFVPSGSESLAAMQRVYQDLLSTMHSSPPP